MDFITDIPCVHKHPVYSKLYRAWKNIQKKASKNKLYTISPNWTYLSSFIEDIASLPNYDKYYDNPSKFKITLKSNVYHYSKDNVFLKEILVKTSNPYNISQEEYDKIFTNYIIKYHKYQPYVNLQDYKELINYGIGCATVSFKQSRKTLFVTFANKVVKNRLLDYIRDNKKHLLIHSLDAIVFHSERDITLIQNISDTFDLEVYTTLKDNINNYVKSLEPLEQELLSLHLQGYNQREISDLLKVHPSLVSRRYLKILKQLKELI